MALWIHFTCHSLANGRVPSTVRCPFHICIILGKSTLSTLPAPPPPPCQVNREALEELLGSHPIIPLIMTYRRLTKLLDTLDCSIDAALRRAEGGAGFGASRAGGALQGGGRKGVAQAAARRKRSRTEAIASAAAASSAAAAAATAATGGEDGGDEEDAAAAAPLLRVRGVYNQTETPTGRLAMEEPNLTCVQKRMVGDVQHQHATPKPVSHQLATPARNTSSKPHATCYLYTAIPQTHAIPMQPLPPPSPHATPPMHPSMRPILTPHTYPHAPPPPSPAQEYLMDPSSQQSPGDGPNGARQHESNIRRAFAPPPGFLLLSADYRQIELRVLAHFSGDEGLCATLADPSFDPFVQLASKWLRIPHDKVCGGEGRGGAYP